MTAEACREWRERLGGYVLDQLAAEERAATAAHLEGCAACRAEAGSLAPLAGLLAKADPARLSAPPSPPPELAGRIARVVSREGRRRRLGWRLALGLPAAAAAAAAIIAAIVLVSPGPERTAQRIAFDPLPRGVQLTATVEPRSFGTQIRMRVIGMRSGTLCRVFMQRRDGRRVRAGSFRYRYSDGGPEEAVLSSALDLSEASALGVRAGDRTFVAPLNDGAGSPQASIGKTTRQEVRT
ncbi:MAG: zf-HC2 domain-containing protein [Actinomycetota bacterium]